MLRKKFPATSFTGTPVLSDSGFDLLTKLLAYDPDKVTINQFKLVFSHYISICLLNFSIFFSENIS